MSAIYDNWDRLVGAVLRRVELRQIALRTPSDVSLASSLPSLSESSSFNYQIPSLDFSKLPVTGYSYTRDQILLATNHFDSTNLIKIGLSGELFYGVLEGGMQVVVKRVDFSSAQYHKFLARSLKSELEFYAKVSHPKFVPFLGHCLEDLNYKCLVYKYLSNNDLYSYFLKKTNPPVRPSAKLDWKRRLQVAIGVAQALYHLHHECVPPLVHRNVEASSILVDENLDGYLGRNWEVCTEKKERNPGIISKLFGLPKVGPEQDATCAHDVYCFGKVLCQLVGMPMYTSNNNSRESRSLEDILIYFNYNKELFLSLMDPSLAMDEHLLNEIWEVAAVAKACLSYKPSKRPQMKNVLKVLEDCKRGKFTTSASSPLVPALGKTKLPEGSESVDLSQVTTNLGMAGQIRGSANTYQLV